MKVTVLQAALGSALLLAAPDTVAAHLRGHRYAHSQYGKRTHGHGHKLELRDAGNQSELAKRGVCSLPNDPTLVHVPGAMNGGFAMAPDVSCSSGKYCPIACPPGMLMAQWKPGTSYSYPQSMDGGLYCDGGVATKPFPNKPYCVEGTGTVSAVNKCGQVVSFCQTVLPGDEGMYIKTDVMGTETLAVPDPSYWARTSAQ